MVADHADAVIDKHRRDFLHIVSDLQVSLGRIGLLTRGRLQLNKHDRQTVHEKDHVRTLIAVFNKSPLVCNNEGVIIRKRTYSCNHCFAQIVVCGDCGELYRRVHWNNHGCKSIVWRCISRLEPTSADVNCTNRTVNETLLEEVTIKALNQILSNRKAFLKQLQENIARAVVTTDTLSPDGIQARLEELQKDLVKAVGDQKNYEALTDEILRLQQMKKDSEVDDHRRTETINRIKELQDFIAEQKSTITKFDESDVRKLIQKITVYEDKFTVEFKSGVSVDITE